VQWWFNLRPCGLLYLISTSQRASETDPFSSQQLIRAPNQHWQFNLASPLKFADLTKKQDRSPTAQSCSGFEAYEYILLRYSRAKPLPPRLSLRSSILELQPHILRGIPFSWVSLHGMRPDISISVHYAMLLVQGPQDRRLPCG
jgi:hypothetical protein